MNNKLPIEINKLIKFTKINNFFYCTMEKIIKYNEYINNDFINLFYIYINKKLYKEENDIFIKFLKYIKYKNTNNYFYNYYLGNEEGYNISIGIYNSNNEDNTLLGGIMLSGLLKYYTLWFRGIDDKNLEKNIKSFLEKEGYQELTPKIGNVELDIVGGTFMSYKDWQEKAKEIYKEYYIDVNMYFNEKMDLGLIQLDREKDFEEYCEQEYEGPYTVKHLLFGESFIGELIEKYV